MHYIHPDIIYEDCQKRVADHVFLLGLGSRCDIADVLKSRQFFFGRLSSMLKINVALPNGHAELLTLLPSSTLQELKTAAQQAFGKKYLKRITAKNQVLVNFEQTIEEAEIEDGECLTALVLQPQLAATKGVQQIQSTLGAFAAILADGSVITWGDLRILWRSQFGSSRFSSRGCSRFNPRLWRFWQMDPS